MAWKEGGKGGAAAHLSFLEHLSSELLQYCAGISELPLFAEGKKN
jgi:hypothetical protein